MTKKRNNWQSKGFKSFQDYQKAVRKANISRIFDECLQEAAKDHTVKQNEKARQHQEATDRLKYHNLRLQGLC